MGNYLISIIVPAYNIENYIERCIQSILSQSYKNLEVIIVDDGSTDKTPEILDRISESDSRVVVIHKNNGGVSTARLAGIERASGEYIGFVDGDDYIEPDMYEHLLDNALKYNADISHCGYQMIFPDGHVDYYYNTGKLVEQNNLTGIIDLIKGDLVEPGLWNKLYKSEIVKNFSKNSLWDVTVKINEDLLMNYLLFKQSNNSIYEDIPFYHYILRKGSAATSNTQRYKITDPLKVSLLIKEDTMFNKELYHVAYNRYIRLLIHTSSQNCWEEDAVLARQTLKNEIKSNMDFKNNVSGKLKYMAIIDAYFYGVYKVVRKVYDRLTGVSDKYKI